MNDPSKTADLIRRAQRGDDKALASIYSRYYPRVQKIVRIRLNRRLRRRNDSTDFVQETFVSAIERFDRFEFRHESSLINWLAKIAENAIRGKARRASQRMMKAMESVSGASSAPLELEADVPPPIDIAVRDEEQTRLEDCIGALRPEYREVIVVRDFTRPPGSKKKMPWNIVAEEIDACSPDAARMLHARARVELAELMKRSSTD